MAQSRKKRVPVFQQRGSLTVIGEDPNYVYRWVNDLNESGGRIVMFTEAGYVHVKKGEVSSIGDTYAFDSEFAGGSIVRKPCGKGTEGFLYYMKIKREWYDEDQQAKESETAERESQIQRTGTPDGEDIEGGYDKNARGQKLKREIDISSRGRQ